MREQVKRMALELGVKGLMNVQLAWQDDKIYVIEVNPRASRTVPFVSKCIGVSLAKVAARCMVGQTLAAQGFTREIVPPYFSVKEAVLPFNKFPGVDPILGPEMKSTGEVMGTGDTFAEAFAKAQLSVGQRRALPGARPCSACAMWTSPVSWPWPGTSLSWAFPWWRPAAPRRCWSRRASPCAGSTR